MKIQQLLSVLALACCLIIAGCDSDGGGPISQPRVYAGKDSRFTYTKTDKTAEGTPIFGTDTTIVAVVAEGVHSFQGKDSVITVIENGQDTMHMAYEPNGDVSLYGGFDLGGFPNPFGDTIPKWWTLPVVTKGELPIMSLDLDFTIDMPPISVTIKKLTAIADYKTTEQIDLGSEKLSSGKIEVVFTVNFELSGFPSSLNFRTTYWYSDKIGYFSKFDIQNDQLPIGGFDPGNFVQVLTSYSLK